MARRRSFDTSAWLASHAPAQVAPEDFRVPEGDVSRSMLAGRVVVRWADPGSGAADASGHVSGAHAIDPPTGVLDRGLLRVWADAQWVTHMGPAVMTAPGPFLGALRRLADRLLLGATARGGGDVVETVAPSVLTRALVASLYPDARQVEPGDTGDRGDRGTVPLRAGAVGAPVEGTRPAGGTADGDDGPELLVVLASGRSGTTWLSRLLQLHPAVGGIGEDETWLFELLSPLWDLVHDVGALGAHCTPDSCAAAVRAFCAELFAATLAAHAPGASVFVEKTPGHVHHLPFLAAVYPDARFVHLLRDGRDVARSLAGMEMAAERDDPAAAARAWRAAVLAVRSTSPELRHLLEVRYEDLVADPAGGVAAVLEWAGCLVGDDVRAALAGAAAQRVSTWSGTGSAVGAATWRSMSPWALARVYAAAGDALVSEGYLGADELRAARRSPMARIARLLERRDRGRRSA